MRVLVWNLFHGRAVPAAGRDLCADFSRHLAAWDWDLALLQEVPPWWPARLAAEAGAEQRTALTSRNSLLPLRRALAERWPDAIKSNGGGANAVLSKRPILAHRALRLRHWPERRVAQLVRVQGPVVAANFHGSARPHLAGPELERLWQAAAGWAGEGPLIVGGDLNLRQPTVPDPAAQHAAQRDVDHLFVRGLRVEQARVLAPALAGAPTHALSDHPPLLVSLNEPS